jgi:hypothetical protein
MNALAHTLNTLKNTMWSDRCAQEISQHSRMKRETPFMYTSCVQTPGSSHDEWRHGCVRTLFIDIFGYDVKNMGEHLLEDMAVSGLFLARTSRAGLWSELSGWIELIGKGRWSFHESKMTDYYGADYGNEMLEYCGIFGAWVYMLVGCLRWAEGLREWCIDEQEMIGWLLRCRDCWVYGCNCYASHKGVTLTHEK